MSHSSSSMYQLTAKYDAGGSVPLFAFVVGHLMEQSAERTVKFQKKSNLSDGFHLICGPDKLHGEYTVARFFARCAPMSRLYGSDALSASQVDEWLSKIAHSLSKTESIESTVPLLDEHLTLRTFLVGHSLSLADCAAWSVLQLNHDELQKVLDANSKGFRHFRRWFQFLSSQPAFEAALTDAALGSGTQGVAKPQAKSSTSGGGFGETGLNLGKMGNFDALALHNAVEGEIVTRFPPEPSGYLHIGHVKAVLMNHFFARKYKGKMLLRFDDTNPGNESEEFVQAQLEDLQTLGVTWDGLSHTSDHFDKLIELCTKVISEGKAFVDFTPAAKMSEERMAGEESACRSHSVKENLRLWKAMQEGTEEGLKCVVRMKLDMKDKNSAMRDPAIYRCCVGTPHLRTGTKYKVYPLYDFACPIVDSIEGVTHALRSNEYHLRNPLYYAVCDMVGLRRPQIEDFSRVNFEYVLLSKRKLQKLVDTKMCEGWDDPRFPTLRGILRRGLELPVLRDFILSLGASKSDVQMNMTKLWALNRRYLDPRVPRYTALDYEGRVHFVLSDGPSAPEQISVPLHRKNPELGDVLRTVYKDLWMEATDAAESSEGEEVTLMDWGNVVIDSIERDDSGVVVRITGHTKLDGDVKKTKRKICFLPDLRSDKGSDDDGGYLVRCVLKRYDFLITAPRLKKDDDFDKFINHDSEHSTVAMGDCALRNLKKGDKIQLNRKGYFIVDRAITVDRGGQEELVLIEIPS